MAPTLQIRLLGDFQLLYRGEPATAFHQARLRSLLAYLVLHRHASQTRQRLAFLFWPESNERQAYSNLRKALSALRGAVPDAKDFLHIDAKVVQWSPASPFVLDVAQFEHHLGEAECAAQNSDRAGVQAQLDRAVALYEGDLLPNCYDDWIVPERERLRERFLLALAQLSEGLEQARDYPAAIRHATRLLRTDPLHEETHRRLMRLHLLNGDRAAALRAYHTCAAILQRELGVTPGPPTQEAYAHLLHLEAAPVAPPRQGRRTRDLLVGRQTEWQRLTVVWQQTTGGQAQFVLIGGEPGIGKTRLVEELAQWVAQQGFAAAYARAYAAEGHLAYDPIAAWLRSEALGRRLSTLADVWLAEAARLVPELRAGRPHLPAPEPLSESWQHRHFFEALARAVLAVPEPLLLVLDDLQWCDRETLEWLHFLLRFDPRHRLLVVGTARLGEIDAEHPLRSLLRELRQTEQVAELELAPLDEPETAQLAQQAAEETLDPTQTRSLYRASEGNPLLVQEMVRAKTLGGPSLPGAGAPPLAHDAPLPAKMQAVIESRLARLSPAARRLAALAATIGRSFTFATLRQAGGAGDDLLVAALDELWQRRIVREQGSDSYDFSHDKIREVVYAGISPMWRRMLHRQVAQALEQIHHADLSPVNARIAGHYRQAGDAAKAAAYYFRSTYEMQFGFAFEEMLTRLQQGLAVLQDQPRTAENVTLEIALHMAIGRILTARAGWTDAGARAALETARQLCIESSNWAQLMRTQDYLWVVYANFGEYDRALALGRSNLELAAQLDNQAELEGAHGGLGFLLFYVGDLAAARAHLEQAAALAARPRAAHERARHPLIYTGAYHRVLLLLLLGYPDAAQRYLHEVLAVQEAQVGPLDLTTAYEFCVMFHHWRREWQTMQVYAQKLAAVAEKHEFATFGWIGRCYTAATSAALGESNEGGSLLRQSIAMLQARGIRMFIPYMLCLLAEVDGQLGQSAAALTALDEAITLAAATGEQLCAAETQRLRGDLLAAQGAVLEAELAYERALAAARGQQVKWFELRAAVSLSRLWQAQGKRREAHDLLAPIYAWFTEGFDTPDLQAAQALLTALAG